MKKIIKQLFETQTSILEKKLGAFKGYTEEKIECAIDDDVVDCKDIDTPPYTGVPAPIVPENDPWFDPPIITEFAKDYMEREHEAFKEEAHKFYGTKESKEPDNIHQIMYEMATKDSITTIQLDPLTPGGSENFQGGSENIHT